MHNAKIVLIFFIFISCSSNEKDQQSNTHADQPDLSGPVIADKIPAGSNDGEAPAKRIADKQLYFEGIYEYVYEHNTADLSENHFIAFTTNGDQVEGWYYGTSDEFDEAREGYLPGYFVSRIDNLITRGDSLFFDVNTGYNKCFKNPITIGHISHSVILETNEIWNDYAENHVLHYKGKVYGLTMTLVFKGETRKYKKKRNFFYAGIDNFDASKCRSEALLAIQENLSRLNESLILDFLSSFSVICEPNVEFNQWSNELLFNVMEREPEMFVRTLYKNIAAVDTTAVFSVMRSPLLDPDLEAISKRISVVHVDQDFKDKMVGLLTGGSF